MNFRNILISWRNICKDGVFSIINVVGLAIGISVVTLILFWVADELSFDKFHKNLKRIYTVYEHQQYSDGQELFTACTPFPLSRELAEKYTEVENATTFTNIGRQLLCYEDKKYNEGPVYCADKEFLNIFSYKILEGSPDVLDSPDQIVITDELAGLLFGNEPALGKIISFNESYPLTVGAVIATEKRSSNFNFKVLASPKFMRDNFEVSLTEWGNNWPRTSLLFSENTDVQEFEAKIASLCKKNGQENTTLHLFPFKNERLYSYSGKNNRIQYIYQFLGIALIIILIASINFINLSTAKAEQRKPEIGIRKALGAGKFNVFSLFLLEKGILIVLSLILSIILTTLFLPVFRSVADKTIELNYLQNKYMIIMLVISLLLILFISIIYPSLYLSSFNPVLAIKKLSNRKNKDNSLKSLLVVAQFAFSVILISSSIVITRQIRYINNYNLGYNKANLIYLRLQGDAYEKHELIKQELNKIPGIISLTKTKSLPFYGGSSTWGYDWEGKDPDQKVLICNMNVDKNFFKTMDIKFAAGKAFSKQFDNVRDINEITLPEVILNQEAIRRIGMKDPIGKSFGSFNNHKGKISGVVEDFHFQSLHNGIEPLVIMPLYQNPDFIIVRISPEGFSNTVDEIKKTWAELLPQSVCDIGFFDNSLQNLYNSEVRISNLFKYFSLITIFISCIGLFGLSLFIIERRNKEIGVRKVNGAKISEVIFLLNRNFVQWIFIAFIIAVPVVYYTMHRWLENFEYKTTIDWWIYALAGLLILSIALLTVSWQSWRAASRNPVEALRYE